MTTKTPLAIRISEARRAKKFTQHEVAQRVARSPQTISFWETGRTVPKLAELRTLADLFSVSLEWLAEGEMPMISNPMDNTTSSRVIEFLMARLEDVEAQLAEVKNAQRLARERRARNGQKAVRPTTGTEHGS